MNRERYDRQIRIPEIGLAGQEKLAAARVLVVGAGGLGSPAILYLAAAGVGTLGIADGDRVSLSNLNRQVLHRTCDIGRPKVECAARAVAELNPEVRLEIHPERLAGPRVEALAANFDLVIDAADSFASKYMLNDACRRAGVPLLHAGVQGLVGQTTLLGLPGGPCLRCIFPDQPPDPDEPLPILGATAGVLGALQACEAVKHLAGLGSSLAGRMLVVDLRRLEFVSIEVTADPECRTCRLRID